MFEVCELTSLSFSLLTFVVILYSQAFCTIDTTTWYILCLPHPLLLTLGRCAGSKLSIVPSLADNSTATDMAETPAMVAIPSIGMEALAVVPFYRKSHPEFVQRRVRRPFSALEVEALVQAVEKLGTGRYA